MPRLVALLRKKKMLLEAPPEPAPEIEPVLLPAYGRIFLLVADGSYTYRLSVFADAKSTATYVDAHLLPEQPILAFRASDPDAPSGRSQSGEALVLVPEDGRPDIVRPYSFIDVESARSFLAEGNGGAEAERPMLLWAEPVAIPRGISVPPTDPTPDTSQRRSVVVHHPHSSQTRAMAPGGAPGTATATTASAVSEAEAGTPGLLSRVGDWPGWVGLGPRMVAASRASKAIYYDAVDDDPYADGRAALIVVIGAFSAGLGALGDSVSAPLWHFAGAIAGWMLAVSVVHLIAITLLPGKRPKHAYRRLAVALGLAYSPAIFLMLGAVPVYGPMFTLAVLGWLVVTAVVAIETSLELERESALVTAFGGWMFLFAFALVIPQLIT